MIETFIFKYACLFLSKSLLISALRDEAGTFIINGPGDQSKNGVYTLSGREFHYTRSPLGPESLHCIGPLARDVTIMVGIVLSWLSKFFCLCIISIKIERSLFHVDLINDFLYTLPSYAYDISTC